MTMPILTLQRRLREVGRIRIGKKVPTSNGKQRPAKLETFRLTSQDRQVIEAAAGMYGGTAQPWADAPAGASQWEVITETTVLAVIVPPSEMAFSQYYELWSGGGCKRRCDGQWEFIGDRACVCDPEEPECAPHTRVSVMLRDLPGLGVWRLDTQGYYAAVELAGAVQVCQTLAARGQMLPARLRLEQRQVKREGEQVKKFAVPVLDVDVAVGALASGGAVAELPAATVDPETGEVTERPALRPVPVDELPPGPQLSVAEQMAVAEQPKPGVRRSNAAAPIPSTGVRPRTAAEAEGGGTGRVCVRCGGPLAGAPVVKAEGGYAHRECPDETPFTDDATRAESTPETVPDGGEREPDPEPAPAARWVPSEKDIGKLAGQAFAAAYEQADRGDKTRTVDRLRYALTYAITAGPVSLKDIDDTQKRALHQWLREIVDGRVGYTLDADGATFTLGDRKVRVAWAQFEERGAA